MNPVDSHENTANIEETHFALENANDLHAKILEDGKLTISANETDKGGKIVDT